MIGVPSQDFNQESADNGTVKRFCEATFGVEFPMAGITHVRGADAAPFYAWVREQRRWEPNWNFNKVLIGRDGQIAGTFGSGDEPQGPKLSQAIEAELAKGSSGQVLGRKCEGLHPCLCDRSEAIPIPFRTAMEIAASLRSSQ